jgi:single-strand DNA-binding protein
MGYSYEHCAWSGRLGRKPELRYTPDGTPVTDFSLAVDRSYTKDGERVQRTLWLKVTCWRRLAEIVNEHLDKGREVTVVGELKITEDGGPVVFQRNDGTYGAQYEVTASEVKFHGSRGDTGGSSRSSNGASKPAPEPVAEDEIPF